ncbi:MAG: hypothetical protein ACRDUY_15415 [Nitriliruptorales bacterium]
MATPVSGRTISIPTRPESRSDEFVVVASELGLGYNFPQRMADRLWAPMFVMGVMGLAAGLVAAFVRAGIMSSDPGDAVRLAQLQHVTAGLSFIGFLGVFSGIVFAIARILGAFRKGGGEVQEAVVPHVQTLKMPTTAKAMIALMAMGMMAILVPVILHFVVAAGVTSSEADLVRSEQWFVAIEGVRRLGIALYLVAIALGLATIVHVLRFQAVRILELVRERPAQD